MLFRSMLRRQARELMPFPVATPAQRRSRTFLRYLVGYQVNGDQTPDRTTEDRSRFSDCVRSVMTSPSPAPYAALTLPSTKRTTPPESKPSQRPRREGSGARRLAGPLEPMLAHGIDRTSPPGEIRMLSKDQDNANAVYDKHNIGEEAAK